MKAIIKSIKENPLDSFLMPVIAVLYLLNNRFLKYNTSGIVNVFFKCYFNDLMAPCFLLAYTNIFLGAKGKRLKKIEHIIPFCLCAGLIWEFFTPLVKSSSVTDFFDIVSYLTGGTVYFIINRIKEAKSRC